MLDSFRRRLAAFISPETAREIGTAKVKGAADDDRIAGLITYNEDLQKRLGSAATTIASHMQVTAALRNALRVAKPYVQDALEDAEKALNKLGATSKQRPAAAAAMLAVGDDLKKITSAMNANAATNGQKFEEWA